MKLWEKDISTEQRILAFTTGMDPVYDMELAASDVTGSMAHAIMLCEVGLLGKEETMKVLNVLSSLFHRASLGITLEEGVEDIHSQVEKSLTESLGETGKKIHTGRSRNDQVMVDIKLFLREEIRELTGLIADLAGVLLARAEELREVLMPGYTHMQVAMPSSFGLWFGAYAEALADDLVFLKGVYDLVNQNPLGSAAGYGSSFQVDRRLTTQLLRFGQPHISAVNAQLNRGKTEWYVSTGIGAVATTVARMAMDAVLYSGQNFGFMSLPEDLTTGSSIMPHKKNPDVLELIRAKSNRLASLPADISSVTGNLPSGYHRDYQVLKEILHPALTTLKEVLAMSGYVMERLQVRRDILASDAYRHIYSVEEVNRKVKQGIPFRDAYREVASEIDKGRYRSGRDHAYTHLGSIGDPGIREIGEKLDRTVEAFRFVPLAEIAKALGNYYKEK